jgi:hypothetical protein
MYKLPAIRYYELLDLEEYLDVLTHMACMIAQCDYGGNHSCG